MSKEKDKEKNKKMGKRGGVDMVLETHRAQRAGARRDTAVQKGRGEVSGGGKKPYRQKGTGRARQGTIRATQWRGGSRAFGRQFKNHEVKVNRKVRQAALLSVIAAFRDENHIVSGLPALDAPSTAKFAAFLGEKGIAGKVLFIHGAGDATLVKSARNIRNVTCLHADSLHLQALLDVEWIVAAPETLARFAEKSPAEGAKS